MSMKSTDTDNLGFDRFLSFNLNWNVSIYIQITNERKYKSKYQILEFELWRTFQAGRIERRGWNLWVSKSYSDTEIGTRGDKSFESVLYQHQITIYTCLPKSHVFIHCVLNSSQKTCSHKGNGQYLPSTFQPFSLNSRLVSRITKKQRTKQTNCASTS